MDRTLTIFVRDKIHEAIERTLHLIELTPVDRLGWRPPHVLGSAPTGSSPTLANLGHLLGHLLDCTAGFCAAFCVAFPNELDEFVSLRNLPVNQSCSPAHAKTQIMQYEPCIRRGFEVCTDAALASKVRTVFVPEGEPLLVLLLGNLEHLLNHKYQLFFYLKLLGVSVATADLYHLRGVGDRDASL